MLYQPVSDNGKQSVTMDFDLFFACNAFCEQELKDVASFITLKLNDGAPFFVFDDCAIATPRLFELAEDFLKIEVFWESLHKSQALSGGTLLEM